MRLWEGTTPLSGSPLSTSLPRTSLSHNRRAALQHLPHYAMPEVAGVWVTTLGKHLDHTAGGGLSGVGLGRGRGEQEVLGETQYIALEASKVYGGVFVLHLFSLVQKIPPLSEQCLGKGRHCVRVLILH